MTAKQAQERAALALAGRPACEEVHRDTGHDVVGSGTRAALSSSAFFASGAAVPVLPLLLGLTGAAALFTAVVLVVGALLITGATVACSPAARRAARAAAAGDRRGRGRVTYLLGLVFGAPVG